MWKAYYARNGLKKIKKNKHILMARSAMRKVEGENCAMLEAHSDAEIFRSRLGKAIDFEYVRARLDRNTRLRNLTAYPA